MYNTATDRSLDMALGRQISLLISLRRYGALNLYTRIPAMINYILPSSSRCLTRDLFGRELPRHRRDSLIDKRRDISLGRKQTKTNQHAHTATTIPRTHDIRLSETSCILSVDSKNTQNQAPAISQPRVWTPNTAKSNSNPPRTSPTSPHNSAPPPSVN
jgi:hypothetical protein